MWLLDANLPVQLLQVLSDLGKKCDTAKRHGWQTLRNGDLVAASAQAGFECVLTQDRLFAASAAPTLSPNKNFAVVIITLPQKPWKEYREQFLTAWNESPIQPLAGQVVAWP